MHFRPLVQQSRLHSDENPLGHPLLLVLNVHPQSGVYPCERQYAAVAAAVGINPASNATVRCDFGDAATNIAVFSLYLDPPPLAAVDAYWTDYGGCSPTTPTPVAHLVPASISPPNTYTGQALLWSNIVFAAAQAQRGRRPWLLSRYGGLGNQRVPLSFSGDTFQHELTLDWQIQTVATAANTLNWAWSHDIGGFHANFSKDGGAWRGDSDPTNATGSCLYLRWLQFGAVAPMLRTHCGGCGPNGLSACPCERRIWLFTTHFSSMRDALVLRAALMPLLYTLAREAYSSGVGPLRPMYYANPEDDDAYGLVSAHQYMLGPSILAVSDPK